MISTLIALFAATAAVAPGSSRAYLQPLEPVDLPPSIQQGVDMIYIDPEIAPAIGARDALVEEIGSSGGLGDLFQAASPLYTDLRRGLMRYRQQWGTLPQLQIPGGPLMKIGAKGERVTLLRERLGLPPGSLFDEPLAKAVKLYQQAHGLKADGAAGEGTIASLNLGAEHYEQLVKINLDRARRLPTSEERGRYILVDAGAAELFLFEDGRIKDRMKVIVGKSETATPMMAASLRYVSVNPYWNVPPELVQNLIAPRVIAQGMTYLKDRRYDVLSDWTEEATVLDAETVNWQDVAAGKTEIRVRQRPGAGNSMGDMKFMMPNDFGIYLHDTPDKSLFQKEDRWISNGCVRVEDYRRLATWLFGEAPKGDSADIEKRVDMDKPVPVYITYLTAAGSTDGVAFRKDPYGRDAALLSRGYAALAN